MREAHTAPQTLYHGTTAQGLVQLQPTERRREEGVIYATPDRRFALAMIHGSDRDIAVGYEINGKTNETTFYIKELRENALQLLKNPGYLYEVSGEHFTQKGGMPEEWKSSVAVEVVNEEEVQDVLQALQSTDTHIITYEEKERGSIHSDDSGRNSTDTDSDRSGNTHCGSTLRENKVGKNKTTSGETSHTP